ncbi:hypothetical protein PENTCL1PPCAC_6339 [Pristionchus entomophagus]|uniref:C2H2-type domain-containing protein n=1 Tax=Pristionchus entomophagus TaxID=358040 RepID=A0AAV5SS43_9BILA|nr:hypothetical protein PENTCL1PPCAC_6339 [Pristionchus entomophagus]
MAMRAPRIMQRKRVIPYERNRQPESEPSTSTTANVADDIDEVLGSSGVYIRNGVMLRIEDNMSSEERRILSEESAYEAAERFHASSRERRSITIDDSSGFGDSPQPYIENRLPGIADEVESYPCKLCADKVFLTGFGLEKHAKTMHKENISEVIRQIRIIGDEWKRRNVERSKIRERLQAVKYRQEALAMAAAREFRTGSNRNLKRWNPDGSSNYVIPSNQLDMEYNGITTGSSASPFEACSICNLQINVSHPSAFASHMRAHKKNDELREAMVEQYGHDYVDRLTCRQCQLVFCDEKKLAGHFDSMHTRKRKFVCKWCGYVTGSVSELNEHKIDVHAMPPNGGQRAAPLMHNRKEAADGKNGLEKNKNNSQDKHGSRASAMSDDGQFSVTRTMCPDCSLLFNRPSLLLKHMLRVHSKCSFNASIDTKGLPSFSVQVDRGRVIWSCCGRDFNDRVSFSHHRQSHSITSMNDEELMSFGGMIADSRNNRGQTMPSSGQEVVVPSEDIKGEIMDSSDEYPIDQSAIMGEDGTIEIMVPQGVKHDEEMQYMLVVDEDGRRRIVTIDPRSNPEEMMRQHGINMGEDVIESTSREGEAIDTSNYDVDENGQLVMTSEQFEQFRMQYGDHHDMVQVLYVEDGDGSEMEGGNEREEEEDNNDLQHDILEPSQT